MAVHGESKIIRNVRSNIMSVRELKARRLDYETNGHKNESYIDYFKRIK